MLQSVTRNRSNGVYVGTTYVYTLRRADGYQIKLNNLTRNIAELGPIVAKGVTQAMVPRAIFSLNAGEMLHFGPLIINAQSISNKQKSLLWTQVQAVEVKAGFVTIKEVGTARRWGIFEVAKIPNFFVFTVVADEMQRRAGRGR